MENKPKFLLCAKYDFKIVLENRRLGGWAMEAGDCSGCAVKVLVSKSSLDLLAHDRKSNCFAIPAPQRKHGSWDSRNLR